MPSKSTASAVEAKPRPPKASTKKTNTDHSTLPLDIHPTERVLTAADFDPNKVYMTREYGAFKRMEGNRPLDELIFAQLRTAMEIQTLIAPILVNEKFEIVNGQHRYEALKHLGRPIHFIVREGYGHSQMIRFNSIAKNWTLDDYLSLFVTEGFEEYIKLKNYIERYNLTVAVGIMMLTNSLSYNTRNTETVQTTRDMNIRLRIKTFEMGNFIAAVEDAVAEENGKRLVEIQQALLSVSARAVEYVNTEAFIKAFVNINRSEKYNHRHMMSKINPTKTSYFRLFDRLATLTDKRADGYAILLEEIYNLNNPVTTKLYVSLDERRREQDARREERQLLKQMKLESSTLQNS